MNTNIALNTRRPKFNALADRQAAMQIHGAEQAGQLNALKMGQAQQQMQRESQLRNALAQIDTSAPDYNEKVRGVLRREGDFEGALRFDEAIRASSESDRAKMKAELDILGKAAPLLASPESYPMGREALAGVDPRWAAVIPDTYDPEVSAQLSQMGMTMAQRLAQQGSDRDYELGKEKFTYQQTQDEKENELKRKEIAARNTAESNEGMRAKGKMTFDLQKQYRTDDGVKAFREVVRATKRLLTGLKRAPTSAPGTLAAATSFMKLLDPDSVVRESELGAALAAQGVMQQLSTLWVKTQKGRVMSKPQAEEFKALSTELYKAMETEHKGTDAFYAQLATDNNIDPTRIIQNHYLTPKDLDFEISSPDPNDTSLQPLPDDGPNVKHLRRVE